MGDEPAKRAGVEPAAARGEEEARSRRRARAGAGLTEVAREPEGGLLAQRDGALLAALPAHAHALLVEVDVGEIQVDRLAAAQAGGVDELDERAVAQSRAGRRRRAPRAVRRSRRPSARPAAGAGGAGPRIASGTRAGAEREAQERAHSGELARDRAGSELPRLRAAELRRVVGEDAARRRRRARAAAARARPRSARGRTCRRAGSRPRATDWRGSVRSPRWCPRRHDSRPCDARPACSPCSRWSSPATRRAARPTRSASRSGFRVEVYARGLDRPTALAWGPGEQLYATQEGGAVVRVKPRQTIARGFRTPLGLAWDGGRLFVSAQGTLWRIERGRRRAVVSRLPFGRHQQDNVVVHRGRLYFGSGSTCDACAGEEPALGGRALRASGRARPARSCPAGCATRSAWPSIRRTGRLYASVNERDRLGPDEPAETIVEVRQGRRFGWPDCWPSYRRKQLVGSCGGVTRPLAYLEPHSSADGLAVYRGESFPTALPGEPVRGRVGRVPEPQARAQAQPRRAAAGASGGGLDLRHRLRPPDRRRGRSARGVCSWPTTGAA